VKAYVRPVKRQKQETDEKQEDKPLVRKDYKRQWSDTDASAFCAIVMANHTPYQPKQQNQLVVIPRPKDADASPVRDVIDWFDQNSSAYRYDVNGITRMPCPDPAFDAYFGDTVIRRPLLQSEQVGFMWGDGDGSTRWHTDIRVEFFSDFTEWQTDFRQRISNAWVGYNSFKGIVLDANLKCSLADFKAKATKGCDNRPDLLDLLSVSIMDARL
jgi:hypothetical protein